MKSSHSPLSPAMSRGAEGRKSVCVCVLAANTVIKRCQRPDHQRRRVPVRAVEILKKASESVSHQVFMASPRRHTHTHPTHTNLFILHTLHISFNIYALPPAAAPPTKAFPSRTARLKHINAPPQHPDYISNHFPS